MNQIAALERRDQAMLDAAKQQILAMASGGLLDPHRDRQTRKATASAP
jgi:hypothetical protein